MRKKLSPLVWSTSINEAFVRPVFRNYFAGAIGHLQLAGHLPKYYAKKISYYNQLLDQFHLG